MEEMNVHDYMQEVKDRFKAEWPEARMVYFVSEKKVNNDDVENALTIYDVDGYVVADGEKIICHKDGQFVKSKGQIPFFAVGVNKVQTNASVIEITKNERWI